MKFERHPFSAIFGSMQKSHFDQFEKSIKTEGQRVRGIVFEKMVLDGWHRYLVTGEKFLYDEFKGTREEAAKLVTILNLERRHLTDDQRACAAAEMNLILKKKSPGHNQSTPKSQLTGVRKCTHTYRLVCQSMNVSVGRFNRALYLKKHHPKLFEECKNGEKSVNKARVEASRLEMGIGPNESIFFPDSFSHHCEVEKFIKHITKNGWACTLTIQNGLMDATIHKTAFGELRTMGEHYFARAIVSAALPHKLEILKSLEPIKV